MKFNTTRLMQLLRSKVMERGGYTSVNGVGIVATCDIDGNLWTKTVNIHQSIVFNSPAAGVLATVNSNPATNIILKSLHASLTAAAAATAIQTVQLTAFNTLNVGTVIWQDKIAAAAGTTTRIDFQNMNIDIQTVLTNLGGGTLRSVNGLTLAFLAAPGAAEFQAVSFSMYDTG